MALLLCENSFDNAKKDTVDSHVAGKCGCDNASRCLEALDLHLPLENNNYDLSQQK